MFGSSESFWILAFVHASILAFVYVLYMFRRGTLI